jgi:hypothetical protein
VTLPVIFSLLLDLILIRLLPLVETFPLLVKVLLYLVMVVVRVLVKSLHSGVNNKEVSNSTSDGCVRDGVNAGDR